MYKQILTFSNIYCGGKFIGSSQDGGELLAKYFKNMNKRHTFIMASPRLKVYP